MTIEQCYEQFGGSFPTVMSRLLKKERVEKFVVRFLRDDSFSQLEKAVADKDWDLAFRAAHTLKGVSANLELGDLNRASDLLTESLRHGLSADTMKYYDQTVEAYKKTCQVIEAYKKDNGL